MHTIIHPRNSPSRSRSAQPASHAGFRQPNYDCREQPEAIKLVVYVPGVGARGVDIEASGTDLLITARKEHFVRVNWQSLHLENAQRDYRLKLRLGLGFRYADMQAEIHEGILTVTLPKENLEAAGNARVLRRVA